MQRVVREENMALVRTINKGINKNEKRDKVEACLKEERRKNGDIPRQLLAD